MKKLAGLLTLALIQIAPAQYLDSRPVRGAWLRGDGSTIGLEIAFANLRAAGITDVFLETFYHGVTIGAAGTFNQRYPGTDYLAQAIPIATRYGLRLHAWLETSYWQYDTTGGYNFTANPEYRVWNVATNATGGDQALQVFANLTLPGVQAKLRAYTGELAAYAGLWGIQTDYHRFPLDNSTSDNFPSPWSYDTTSQSLFSTFIGSSVTLSTQAARTSQGQYANFLAWRRARIAEAANQMRQGIIAVNSDLTFSGAIFASAMSSSAQVAKCQDWPTMAAQGYLEAIVPMAYGSTTASINTDLQTTQNSASGRPIWAGLAITGGATHPALTSQLATVKARGIESWIVFDGSWFASPTEQTSTKTWLNANAMPQRADLNGDGEVDFRDWTVFRGLYSGSPVAYSGRADWNSDGQLTTLDNQRLRQAIAENRLGARGMLTDGDRAIFDQVFTGPSTGASSPNLMNFDGDADVDQDDRRAMEFIGSPKRVFFGDIALLNSHFGPARLFTFEIADANGQILSTVQARANGSGKFALALPGDDAYRVAVKHEHWLRRVVSVAAGTSDVPEVPMSLRNGDVNGDNIVDIADYSVLAGAFDAALGDAAFVSGADLNEDLIVDIADYAILAGSFDMVGDELN
ncbi:MAG: family 10 glycosylhydrolase [Chthonomonas sp.]|nr:family 10 glycosylhydrolase [Chthonomonas sp.]